jgi:predicted ATP-grasp superfamily ATP-dependent carboligase
MDSEQGRRIRKSRYCRGCFDWDPLHAPIEKTLESLQNVGRRLGERALLVPLFDEAAIFAASYREQLSEHFIYPVQSADLIRALVSKKEMFLLAQSLGVAVPATSWPGSREEVREFISRAKLPLALKAIRGMRLKLRAGVTAFIVSSESELLELYDRYEDPEVSNLMIQEYIPGNDSCGWGFNGYFNKDSKCVLGGTTHRLHQYPVHVGITSLAVIEQNADVDRAARTFMAALGYRGLVNIGFRYDARDGKYKVIDVNPRLGASFRSFVTNNGSDIVQACYRDLTGQSVPQSESWAGRKWMLERGLRSCVAYHREGQAALEVLAPVRGVNELAYFSARDPLPFCSMCVSVLSRPLRRWISHTHHAPLPVHAPTSDFGL